MNNLGKRFEENWKKSVPSNLFYYRFRDSGSTFYGGNQNLRFSTSNIADCLIYDFCTGLHLIELKNHKGKSIPLSCIEGNKTKQKQINDLYEANQYIGVYSTIIVFFVDLEQCFALNIKDYKEFTDKEERKSIPIDYFKENGVEIPVKKIRTNYRYDIESWLKEF